VYIKKLMVERTITPKKIRKDISIHRNEIYLCIQLEFCNVTLALAMLCTLVFIDFKVLTVWPVMPIRRWRWNSLYSLCPKFVL